MLLLGNQQDRSVIDRISSALQKKANKEDEALTSKSSPTPSTPSISSPESSMNTSLSPISTPPIQMKRAACEPLTCETESIQTKKIKTILSALKDESIESDDDGSDSMINEDTASSEELISPVSLSEDMEGGIFCTVPGRLSLLSSTSKYKVTLSEINRRLNYPENLNASILGGILRRAKSKNGGRELRETLEKLGLSLPAGRRKSAPVTLFTSLTEKEAAHLGKDYAYHCQNHFPAKDLAAEVALQHQKNNKNIEGRKQQLAAARSVLSELELLMRQHSGLSTEGNVDEIPCDHLSPITNFNLITHGFGPSAFITNLSNIIKYVDCQLNELETDRKPKQQQQWISNVSYDASVMNALSAIFAASSNESMLQTRLGL